VLIESEVIIGKFGRPHKHPDNYIFHVFKIYDDFEQQEKRIKQFTKTVIFLGSSLRTLYYAATLPLHQ